MQWKLFAKPSRSWNQNLKILPSCWYGCENVSPEWRALHVGEPPLVDRVYVTSDWSEVIPFRPCKSNSVQSDVDDKLQAVWGTAVQENRKVKTLRVRLRYICMLKYSRECIDRWQVLQSAFLCRHDWNRRHVNFLLWFRECGVRLVCHYRVPMVQTQQNVVVVSA